MFLELGNDMVNTDTITQIQKSPQLGRRDAPKYDLVIFTINQYKLTFRFNTEEELDHAYSLIHHAVGATNLRLGEVASSS